MYWCSIKQHIKMIAPLIERNDVNQVVVIHEQLPTTELNIKKIIKYKDIRDVKNIVKASSPDVFIQYTSSRDLASTLKGVGAKSILSAHGVWPESDLNKTIVADPFFKSFDAVCGASYKIKDIFHKHSDPKTLVITDVLTQFDLLHKLIRTNQSAQRKKLIRGADKLITLFGHGISFKTDKLRPYDEGYYDAVWKLSSAAKKNNWMVYVKPKSLKGKRLPQNTNNFIVLGCDTDPYPYFCSDLLITSARSTVEVEAALVNKPIVRLPIPKLTQEQRSFEYGALDFGAVVVMKDGDDINKTIISALAGNNSLCAQQNLFVRHLGITFDGLAHKRLVDALIERF